MCGVVLIRKFDGVSASVTDLRRMASAIRHRGPDGAGYSVLDGGALVLGHVRLSVVDVMSGAQPMFNENGSVCLTFNGEIYDHAELRAMLTSRGHVFRTRSDTEVIVHLYEEFGLDFVHHLNGEFAFALWDGLRRRLVLVKDRFGIKPLFYASTTQEFVVASEAKAILALDRFRRGIAPQYMAGPCLGSPDAAASPFEGIAVLRPGHLMVVDANGSITDTRYWEPTFDVRPAPTFEEASEEVRRRLRLAVRRRLVADVPVGATLSGGVDSTLVCGLMAEHGSRFKAFNLGFGDTMYDESRLAARIAKHYGATFESIHCTTDMLAEHYLETIYHVEAPINNPNSVAKKILSGFVTSQGYKVCLTGEGADELFGGYATFRLELIWRAMKAGGDAALRGRQAWERFQDTERRSEGILWRKNMRWDKPKHDYGYPCLQRLSAETSGKFARLVLSREIWQQRGATTPISTMDRQFDPQRLRSLDPFDASRILTLHLLATYLIPAMGDRVEMANSLECRTPFLDVDLAHYALGLPPSYFLELGDVRDKRILRSAFAMVTPDFTHGIAKHPMVAPTWRVFYQSKRGRELFAELLSARALRQTGLLDPLALRGCFWLWRTLPPGSALGKVVDTLMGFALGVQALAQSLVQTRVNATASFQMRRREHSALEPSLSR